MSVAALRNRCTDQVDAIAALTALRALLARRERDLLWARRGLHARCLEAEVAMLKASLERLELNGKRDGDAQ